MSSLAFDTHKFVTDLNKAGMDTSVAEVLANHYASLLNDRIATKDDLALLRTELKGDLDTLRSELTGGQSTLRTELKGDMAALEERMTVKIVAAQLASFIGVCAVFAAFFTLTGN